ncbi:acyl-CoA/acyl-ACP dehydrogenase [Pseudonocardia sp. DSM 110487]|uniref:acyl-CoA dehydrogenase family protein n=1 Tax=Pseudonocardia sp. DSM 110487 TaxID=2865833 RepID=UPI001C69EDC8|nr:acyl-CoA dehydrogenase family protein [Pseudonocardia sp. DSM 110487]QYN34017.1 acyl-CoA/acyl-ACP dehydrogenase [Pseudonocardia sp. DSM 110487]
MDVLSDELRELGSTSRRLLERSARTSPLPPPFGATARLDRELWSSLAGLGLLGLAVPEELGGSGGGATELCVLAEEVGAALPAVPFAGTAAVAAVLVAGADDGVGRQVLAEVVKGTLVVAPAWETFPAQIVPGRRTALRLEGDRVDGALAAVPFGIDADLVLAFADQMLVLVDTSWDAVRVRAVEALDVVEPVAAVDVAPVAAPLVQIAEVPTARIRAVLAAELVGTAQRALDGAVAYAKERRQFGRPIGSFQAIKHLLADRHVQLDAARMLVRTAAAAIDAGDVSAEEGAAAALVAACDAADATTGDALQVHGGIGFTWEHPSHVFLKRARARRVLLGSQARQLDGLAKLILGR